MNTKDELIELFNTVFDGEIDTSSVDENTVISELGINSIGFLYLAVAIEEKFGAKFHNEDFEKIKTVKDVIDFIEAKK